MSCCGRFKIPSALIFCSVDREGSGRINVPALQCREFLFSFSFFLLFKVHFATAIPRYWRIIDAMFYISFVEDFSGIDLMTCCSWKTVVVFYMVLHMGSIRACHRNLLSTMRPSRRCSDTFSMFWPSSDSLNDKSESWCFCRVVITIHFVFTGLMIMCLALLHTEIRSRQICNISSFAVVVVVVVLFLVCTTLFSCCTKCSVVRQHVTFCRVWWHM